MRMKPKLAHSTTKVEDVYCPVCGTLLEFVATHCVIAHYAINPKTKRIGQTPIRIQEYEDGGDGYYCPKCDMELRDMGKTEDGIRVFAQEKPSAECPVKADLRIIDEQIKEVRSCPS